MNIERFAIMAAKGNNGGEWATHYTEEQKEYWRQFARELLAAERERCAKIADWFDEALRKEGYGNDVTRWWRVAAHEMRTGETKYNQLLEQIKGAVEPPAPADVDGIRRY